MVLVAKGCDTPPASNVTTQVADSSAKPLSPPTATADYFAAFRATAESLLAKSTGEQLARLPDSALQTVLWYGDSARYKAKFRAVHREVGRRDAQALDSVQRESTASRQTFPDELERKYLGSGMDVVVSAIGKNRTTLHMKYVLIGRPTAYQMANDEDLRQSLRSRGFRKMVLTDGYAETYSFTIEPE